MFYMNNKDKQIENCITGCEKLTSEYKKILNSEEYKLGEKIIFYKTLLKNHKYLTILKKLFFRTKKYDKYLNENEIFFSSHQSSKKIAVYTAIFGKYDNILEPIIKPDNIDYYIITDQNIPSNSAWKKIDNNDALNNLKSNIEKNRYCKMFPNQFFNNYDYSIYVDGNVLITSDLTPLIKTLDEYPISMHSHKNRNCVYDEIDACIKKNKGNKSELINHKKLLLANNVPLNFGLLEATVIARKHHDSVCKSIMNQWWNEFIKYSKRDQISLIDVIWKNNVDIKKIATMGDNIFKNNMFIIFSHR